MSRELGVPVPLEEPVVLADRDDLATMFACALIENGHILHPKKMAQTAYEMADEMHKARSY